MTAPVVLAHAVAHDFSPAVFEGQGALALLSRPLLAVAVIAHQGGWDEALFVAVPMAVLVGLLWLAQRRATEEEGADGPEADAAHDADGR